MEDKSIGKFYRRVVIDPRLRNLINEVLRASSADSSAVTVARRRMRELADPTTYYLFASEVRGYLEEKTRIGTEARVFPVAGDLFLDALEANIPTIGPKFFQDHYSGVMGCYRLGDRFSGPVEGALYTIDVLLQKTICLFLERDSLRQPDANPVLSFEEPEQMDYSRSIGFFFGAAEHCVKDAVDAALKLDRSMVPPEFLSYAITYKERIEGVLKEWKTYHRKTNLLSMSDEEFLLGGLEVAENLDYTPLIAMLKEQLGTLHEQKLAEKDSDAHLLQTIHPLYDAGFIHLKQGNQERRVAAFELALRRYSRAIRLFRRIQDRTSVAKALIEAARVHIKRAEDPEAVQHALYEAVSLVMAHMYGMPQDAQPMPTDDMVSQFLTKKGYGIEAEAYVDALQKMQST